MAALIHRLLAETRAAAGLTLHEVADAIGVSTATLSRIERGGENGTLPDLASALLICRWLGVSVEYAMGESEQAACSNCTVLARRLERITRIAGGGS